MNDDLMPGEPHPAAAPRWCANCCGEVVTWHEDETHSCEHCKQPTYADAIDALEASRDQIRDREGAVILNRVAFKAASSRLARIAAAVDDVVGDMDCDCDPHGTDAPVAVLCRRCRLREVIRQARLAEKKESK